MSDDRLKALYSLREGEGEHGDDVLIEILRAAIDRVLNVPSKVVHADLLRAIAELIEERDD